MAALRGTSQYIGAGCAGVQMNSRLRDLAEGHGGGHFKSGYQRTKVIPLSSTTLVSRPAVFQRLPLRRRFQQEANKVSESSVTGGCNISRLDSLGLRPPPAPKRSHHVAVVRSCWPCPETKPSDVGPRSFAEALRSWQTSSIESSASQPRRTL